MTLTSFVFTELANTMKYGGEGVLDNLVFTEWRHCVLQNEVWGRGCYITFFSPSDVTAFHRIANSSQTIALLHYSGTDQGFEKEGGSEVSLLGIVRPI